MAGRCNRKLAALLIAIAWPAASAAAGPPATHRFDIEAGSLRDAVVAIARQGGITVGLTDPDLAIIRVPALHRETTAGDALDRLVADTPARVERIDAVTFRIVRRAASRTVDRPSRSQPSQPRSGREIIVRGSKRDATLDAYPGSVEVVDASRLAPDELSRGSDALVERLPILSSTHLGPGRDKLFIRGVADSSFTGRNQATVGEYLGDVRLNYNAPDPHLALYDLRSVEVLEGPQGTLYGAGALGGILRLEPNEPDLAEFGGMISAAGRLSGPGRPGYDVVAVVNLPLVDDRLGVRVVAYKNLFGGYIDDSQRGLRDVNRTTQNGLRATLRSRVGVWTIDFGFVRQDIASEDGQYAERGLAPYVRRSAIAQPFDNDYSLGSVTARRSFGDLRLTSTSSFVRQDLTTTYDATQEPGAPLVYRQIDRFRLFSNETRLARIGEQLVDWLLGVELLHGKERATRHYGPVAAPVAIPGVDSVIEEASVFGEATVRPVPRLAVTAGARLVFNRRNDETTGEGANGPEPTRHDHSFLPTAALSWKPIDSLTAYVRYQEGFRAGGLAPVDGIARRYLSDTISTFDGGIRFRPSDRLSVNAALSVAHWANIQADLVTAAGFPYVANIGSGRILSADAELEWRATSRLRLEAALFLNDSRLSDPAPGFGGEIDADLPNIPEVVARVGGHYDVRVEGHLLSLHGSARYVGRSRLGVGTDLDLRQGKYVDSALGGSLALGRLTVSIDATNLLDAHHNIFAFGNPFQVSSGLQVTPQTPRTIRFGVSRSF